MKLSIKRLEDMHATPHPANHAPCHFLYQALECAILEAYAADLLSLLECAQALHDLDKVYLL